MNTSPYHNPQAPDFSRSPAIKLLRLSAWFDFKTDTSIGFQVGYGDGNTHDGQGWIIVHHPPDHHVKTRLQCCIPDEYLEWDAMRSIIKALFVALEIPLDETFVADFVSPHRQTGMSEHHDRDGCTDVMTSWKRGHDSRKRALEEPAE